MSKFFHLRTSYLFAVGKRFFDIQKFTEQLKVIPISKGTPCNRNARFQGSVQTSNNDRFVADVKDRCTV